MRSSSLAVVLKNKNKSVVRKDFKCLCTVPLYFGNKISINEASFHISESAYFRSMVDIGGGGGRGGYGGGGGGGCR